MMWTVKRKTCRRNKRRKRVHQDGTAVLDLEKSRRRASKWRSLLTGRHGLGLGYSKDIATLHAMSRSWSKVSHKESITVLLTARLFLRTNWESVSPWRSLILCPRFQQRHNLTWHWCGSSLKPGELLCQPLRSLNKTHMFNVHHSKTSVVRVHINSAPQPEFSGIVWPICCAATIPEDSFPTLLTLLRWHS